MNLPPKVAYKVPPISPDLWKFLYGLLKDPTTPEEFQRWLGAKAIVERVRHEAQVQHNCTLEVTTSCAYSEAPRPPRPQ